MKNVTKILVLALVLISTQSFAQTLKFGHLNIQELVAYMPERDSVNAKLEKYAKELDETLKGMQQEFNTKYQTYNQKQATWTAAILESKTKELEEMDQRLRQFNTNAQQEYAAMQQSLYAPVIKKANDAIDKIGKEGGFIYIFDTSVGSILYNSEVSVDILPIAKKTLGIPADKKLPTAPAAQQQAQQK
ncbi:MAG: OmpH family outer membrane protein [Bacteroidales bacterium]